LREEAGHGPFFPFSIGERILLEPFIGGDVQLMGTTETASKIREKAGCMGYQKINVEFIVFSEEADAVVADLHAAIDRLDEKHTIFGGEIETVPVAHSGTRRKSALRHTLDAGTAATSAVKLAAQKVADAYKKVI
jgi:hypothetical protein